MRVCADRDLGHVRRSRRASAASQPFSSLSAWSQSSSARPGRLPPASQISCARREISVGAGLARAAGEDETGVTDSAASEDGAGDDATRVGEEVGAGCAGCSMRATGTGAGAAGAGGLDGAGAAADAALLPRLPLPEPSGCVGPGPPPEFLFAFFAMNCVPSSTYGRQRLRQQRRGFHEDRRLNRTDGAAHSFVGAGGTSSRPGRRAGVVHVQSAQRSGARVGRRAAQE